LLDNLVLVHKFFLLPRLCPAERPHPFSHSIFSGRNRAFALHLVLLPILGPPQNTNSTSSAITSSVSSHRHRDWCFGPFSVVLLVSRRSSDARLIVFQPNSVAPDVVGGAFLTLTPSISSFPSCRRKQSLISFFLCADAYLAFDNSPFPPLVLPPDDCVFLIEFTFFTNKSAVSLAFRCVRR